MRLGDLLNINETGQETHQPQAVHFNLLENSNEFISPGSCTLCVVLPMVPITSFAGCMMMKMSQNPSRRIGIISELASQKDLGNMISKSFSCMTNVPKGMESAEDRHKKIGEHIDGLPLFIYDAVKPTFEDHLLNFSSGIYRDNLEVLFVHLSADSGKKFFPYFRLYSKATAAAVFFIVDFQFDERNPSDFDLQMIFNNSGYYRQADNIFILFNPEVYGNLVYTVTKKVDQPIVSSSLRVNGSSFSSEYRYSYDPVRRIFNI